MRRLAFIATLAVALGGLAPSGANAVSFNATKIGLVREGVDGTLGRQRLAGHVTVRTQRSWRWTSHDGAPTAAFAIPTGSCRAVVRVSVRAVATGRSAAARARAVTDVGSAAVLADAARPGGWIRLTELGGGRPQLYGIAIVLVARNRWPDVRAFGSFTGCTYAEIRNGPAARASRAY
jgi:hypothetical protein